MLLCISLIEYLHTSGNGSLRNPESTIRNARILRLDNGSVRDPLLTSRRLWIRLGGDIPRAASGPGSQLLQFSVALRVRVLVLVAAFVQDKSMCNYTRRYRRLSARSKLPTLHPRTCTKAAISGDLRLLGECNNADRFFGLTFNWRTRAASSTV
jgi:hypothetical protein